MSETLSSKIVKTRKKHTCFGCAREFSENTDMEKSSIADNWTVFTTYLCQSCKKYYSENMRGEEFCFGELKDDVLDMEGKQNGRDNNN